MDNPYFHSFIWILNRPSIQDKFAYIKFFAKKMHTYQPIWMIQSFLSYLRLTKFMPTLEIAGNTAKTLLLSRPIFTGERIIAKPRDSKFSVDKKQEVLTWRNTLIRQVKSCIDNNLNPAKVNVMNWTKDKFTQPLSIKEFLRELEVSKDNYYRTLSISNYENLELYFKREPNSLLFNNYLVFVWKLGRQIQTYKLFLMIIRQWHRCVNISQKLKFNANKPWNKLPRKPLRTTCIIMTP